MGKGRGAHSRRRKRGLPAPGWPEMVTVAETENAQGGKALLFPEEAHALIRDLAMYGIPQERMCHHLINPMTGQPIDAGTLQRVFKEDLMRGAAKAEMVLTSTAYALATGRPAEYVEGKLVRAEQAPDKHMVIFLLKTRYKWREDAPEQKPQSDFEMTIRAKVGAMSYEEQKALKHILGRVSERARTGPPREIDHQAPGTGDK